MNRPDHLDAGSSSVKDAKNSAILSSAQIAEELNVSISTVARYRSEYAAYLRSYYHPGGGKGLRWEALEILKLIHRMKSERSHWTEIKQALDALSEKANGEPETTGPTSLRRSLEATHRAQQVIANEQRYFLQNLSQRVEKLEKEYLRLSGSLQKHIQEISRKLTAKAEKPLAPEDEGESSFEDRHSQYPQAENLFPDDSSA
ncbi:MAG: hypothetical protein NTW14_08845 [bacterium]|nr:hypothetical protein [bacterium]